MRKLRFSPQGRWFAPSAAVLLVVGMSLGVARPAQASSADDTIVITHAPPATASAGQNMTLTSHVTAVCPILYNCSGVTLTAYYIGSDGAVKSVKKTGSYASPQAERIDLVIPGSDVRAGKFAYYLVATQEIEYFWEKEIRETESPLVGDYIVVVQ